jgi:hypothetical protein
MSRGRPHARWLLPGLAALAALAGARCTCKRAATDPAPPPASVSASASSAATPPAPPAVIVLQREEALTRPRWTSTDAVAAFSQRRLWWFRPDGDGVAQTTSFDGEVQGLAVAASADVIVVTTRRQAHVFRGPTKLRAFAIEDEQGAFALSDDGALLGTARTGAHANKTPGYVYDVATGARLAKLPGAMRFSPGAGEYALDREGVHRSRDGVAVATFERPEPESFLDWSLGRPAWFGGRAFHWGIAGLVVLDPRDGSRRLLPARCTFGQDETDSFDDAIDTDSGRAVRFCGHPVFGVDLRDLSFKEVRIAAEMPRKGYGPILDPAIRFDVPGKARSSTGSSRRTRSRSRSTGAPRRRSVSSRCRRTRPTGLAARSSWITATVSPSVSAAPGASARAGVRGSRASLTRRSRPSFASTASTSSRRWTAAWCPGPAARTRGGTRAASSSALDPRRLRSGTPPSPLTRKLRKGSPSRATPSRTRSAASSAGERRSQASS